MSSKPALNILEQIKLLKQRGMLFRDEEKALHFLNNISYYRLKGYWWDTQEDYENHIFRKNTFFEDILDRYTFDRKLRIILFDSIERIEIALRTKLIYHLSLKHGSLWYLNSNLFSNKRKTINKITKTVHEHIVDELMREFYRSREVFIRDHRNRHPNRDPEAWKILEVASLGVLSKLYKNLNHQLPEKSIIANEMGLNLHGELSSWLESITYIRNIIAHHSRLWSRNMVKTPRQKLNNPKGVWFANPLTQAQRKKPFLIISCLIYLCNEVTPGHQKNKILDLFSENKNIPIYKLGFLNNWETEDLWS